MDPRDGASERRIDQVPRAKVNRILVSVAKRQSIQAWIILFLLFSLAYTLYRSNQNYILLRHIESLQQSQAAVLGRLDGSNRELVQVEDRLASIEAKVRQLLEDHRRGHL